MFTAQQAAAIEVNKIWENAPNNVDGTTAEWILKCFWWSVSNSTGNWQPALICLKRLNVSICDLWQYAMWSNELQLFCTGDADAIHWVSCIKCIIITIHQFVIDFKCFFFFFLLVFIVFTRFVTFRFDRLMYLHIAHIAHIAAKIVANVNSKTETTEINIYLENANEIKSEIWNWIFLEIYYCWIKRLNLGNHYFSYYNWLNLSSIWYLFSI